MVKKSSGTVEPTFEFQAKTTGDDAHSARIKATYKGADKTADTADDIVIYINLAENALSSWVDGGLNSESTEAYYFLNKILKPSASSDYLVDSVELSEDIEDGAYVDLIYDLNIGLSSVQAVYKVDEDTETTTIDSTNSIESAKTLLNEESYDAIAKSKFNSVGISNVKGVTGTVTWSTESSN